MTDFTQTLDHEAANELWETWRPNGDEDVLAQAAFERMLRYAVDLQDDGLFFRPGGWKVDLSVTAVRIACASAVLASLFHLAGLEDLDREVVIAAAGLIAGSGVNRAQPSGRQLAILDRLRSQGFDGQPLTAEEAHVALKKRQRRAVSEREVAEALDALADAGFADRERSGTWVVRSPGSEAWLRLTFG